jgi:uncharacterized membrane protein YkgB
MQTTQPRFSPTYHLVRIALGLVYFHFGMLKFFPDLSPAELLASQTIMRLSDGMLDAYWALYVLAIMECGLGLAFVFNIFMRGTIVVFFFHMLGTFAPLFVLPELAFKIAPFAPTLEGQYILKNVVFVAAGLGMVPELFFSRQPKTAVQTDTLPLSQTPAELPPESLPSLPTDLSAPAMATSTFPRLRLRNLIGWQ